MIHPLSAPKEDYQYLSGHAISFAKLNYFSPSDIHSRALNILTDTDDRLHRYLISSRVLQLCLRGTRTSVLVANRTRSYHSSQRLVMTNLRVKITARTKTAANFECNSSGPYENKTQKRFSKFCFENHAVIMIESSD